MAELVSMTRYPQTNNCSGPGNFIVTVCLFCLRNILSWIPAWTYLVIYTQALSVVLNAFLFLFRLTELRFYIPLESRHKYRLLWPPYVIGGPLYLCPVISFYLSFFLSFFIPHLISAAADWMSTILLHMVWP